MEDKLEKYIRDNHEKFNEDFSENKVWNKIRGNLKDKKNSSEGNPKGKLIYWKIAAAILLLLTVGLIVDKFVYEGAMLDPDQVVITDPEFIEAENYYSQLINDKQEELEVFFVSSPELKLEFSLELNQLDSMYNILKSDLRTGNSEEVMDAMLFNLQMRVEVLNQQIEILKMIKNRKDETV